MKFDSLNKLNKMNSKNTTFTLRISHLLVNWRIQQEIDHLQMGTVRNGISKKQQETAAARYSRNKRKSGSKPKTKPESGAKCRKIRSVGQWRVSEHAMVLWPMGLCGISQLSVANG